jgi:hypothetical protein
MLAPFAEYFDFAEAEVLRLRDEYNTFKFHIGKAELYSVFLDETDSVSYSVATGGSLVPASLSSVTGEHELLGTVVLNPEDNLEELLYGVPTRFELKDTQAILSLSIWDSDSPETLNEFTYPERLTISISDSTLYNNRTEISDRSFSGFNGVVLVGKDVNGTPTKDTIQIRDDGVYTSREIWSSIDETPTVDGIDGRVIIGYKQAGFSYVVDPYHTAVLDDIEGPLKLRLDISDPSKSFLTYFTDRLKLGSEYRRGVVELDNEEVVVETLLLDASENQISAVDLAISPETTRLYVVDDTGMVHIYDHGWHAFAPPSQTSETRKTAIGVQPLNHYVRLDAEEPMWTHHRRPKFPITKVVVKRIAPSGAILYLQSDLTWGVSSYEFLGDLNATDPVASWQDLKFNVTYDEVGQWEFYVTVISHGEQTVFYSGVMVDAQVAVASLDSGISAPTGIFFTEAGELCITDATNFYKFSEHRDTYYLDARKQQIVLREEYTSIEVTP